MPWKYKTVRAQREEFVLAARQGGNFSALCREFGISRKTGYKWVRRAQSGEELDDRSRKPKRVSARTPELSESKILAVRTEHPGWGARKRQAFQRFERQRCNELWQTDFKGEFRTQDGRYCYPLDILDDHSRFALRIAAVASTAQMVIPVFASAFREYGLPQAVLSDKGAQFAGFRGGYTHFEKCLMDLDVLPLHGRIGHPQTQGKSERFHRTMRQEFLRHHSFAEAADADAQLQVWRHTYNMARPHAALNVRCPGEVYVPSERRFPERLVPFEYGGWFHVRKVNNWGYVRFGADFQIYLSETMAGERIEFRPGKEGDVFVACYRHFKLATFSTENDSLVNRHIARL